MCGIAGIFGKGSCSRPKLGSMAHAMVHRGPDDDGLWQDSEGLVGLVHRRLAIVDLSPAGHQPMHSVDGRLSIVYNGEIYNHLELRRMLDAEAPRPWRGHSDTETLLEAIASWGLETALHRAVGMFALALWNRQTRTLCLARDRFDEPLRLRAGLVDREVHLPRLATGEPAVQHS